MPAHEDPTDQSVAEPARVARAVKATLSATALETTEATRPGKATRATKSEKTSSRRPSSPKGAKPARPARPANAAWRERLRKALASTFRIPRLRDGQFEVIERVMEGRHTLAIMPTGAGKSLCYQAPAVLLPGRTLVVSPLIALMKDQCDKLRSLGVNAVQLNSSLPAADAHAADAAVEDGSARIVFTTPERLADPAFIDLLKRHPVSLLVIDEAHCMSQWGHDFRPAFLEIGPSLRKIGSPTVLALTATATESVIDDIREQLHLAHLAVLNSGIFRDNLHYRVDQLTREDEKLAHLLQLVQAQPGSGMVYAATVKAVEDVHRALLDAGVAAVRYHGKLAAGERRANQDLFMRNEARVMVATNAFGLGIDKPDTRFVIHYQLPSGLTAYYQESGRAGRDGKAAFCTLLFLLKDKAIQQFLMIGRYPAKEDVQRLYRALSTPCEAGDAWTVASLQEHLQAPRTKLQVELKLLREQKVVTVDREGRVALRQAQLSDADIAALVEGFEEKGLHDREMLERMVFYGHTGFCRWKVLLEHFGEEHEFDRCGHCDNCLREQARAEVEEPAADEPAPSPLPSPAALFAPGSEASVPRHGVGRVLTSDSQTVTLQFPDGARRTFVAAYAHPVEAMQP